MNGVKVGAPCSFHTKEPFLQSHGGEQYTVSLRKSLSQVKVCQAGKQRQRVWQEGEFAVSIGWQQERGGKGRGGD